MAALIREVGTEPHPSLVPPGVGAERHAPVPQLQGRQADRCHFLGSQAVNAGWQGPHRC